MAYNIQIESVRSTLKGKIRGFENGLKNIKSNNGSFVTVHAIEFTLRELKEVLEQLEYFDPKDKED